MTNADSINYMQNFQSISKRVIGMYAPDPTSSTPQSLQDMAMHAWLKTFFEKVALVAQVLSKIMIYMKSQRKRDPKLFRDLLFQFSIAWKDAFPDKNTFNKLHFLLYHLPGYVDLWEMLGIVNEESFKAFHAKLVSVKDDLSGMPSITSRVNTTNARTQSLLKEEIMKLNVELHAATTGKKTGKQENKRARKDDEGVRYVTPVFGTETIDNELYIVLPDDSLLNSNKFKDYFLFFGSSKVPSSWMEAFCRTDELSSQDQIKVQYTTALK